MTTSRIGVLLALAGLLAACADNRAPPAGDALEAQNVTASRADDKQRCARSLSGGDTRVEASCTGCTISDPELAIDGDPDTAATVDFVAGELVISGIAQDGVIFPQGNPMGVLISVPTHVAGHFSIQSYRDGESNGETYNTINGIGSGPEHGFYRGRAAAAFDQVEFSLSLGSPASVKIFAICAE